MKKFWPLILILIVSIIFGVGIVVVKSHQTEITSPIKDALQPTKIEVKENGQNLKEYTDESGFQFKYPANLKVKAVNTKDESIYSSLEILSAKNNLIMTITAVSSDLKNLDEWFTKNKISKPKNQIKLKLADLDAIQFLFKKDTFTLALDQGVLFTLSLTEQGNNLKDINDLIIRQFKFINPTEELNSVTVPDKTSLDIVEEWTGEQIKFYVPLHWPVGKVNLWIERYKDDKPNQKLVSNKVTVNILSRWSFYPQQQELDRKDISAYLNRLIKKIKRSIFLKNNLIK